jgi:gluconolactonase
MRDFAIFAGDWRSQSGDAHIDPNSDISMPADGLIDEKDLAVFSDNWLESLTRRFVAPGARLQQEYAASKYLESPTWDPVTGKLYITNRTDKQILRLDGTGVATVWMNRAPGTNGTFLSIDGRLLTADEDTRQIRSHRIGASGPEDTRVLAGPAQGIKTKPNDLCQLRNGDIYFTGPDWSLGPNDQGIYLLRPDGSVTVVKTGLYQPNGIVSSNNDSKLYVAESSSSDITRKRWWVFPINGDGTLGTGSVFFKPKNPPSTNDPDGMTIDEYGNLYFCGLGGVWIVSPAGEPIEMIPVPEFCSNVAFGGPANRILYVTCQNKVYSLAMLVRGH